MCKEIAKKEALQILKVHDVAYKDYEGIPASVILEDLQAAYPDVFPYSSSKEEIADEIYRICTTERGWMPQEVIDFDGDASRYGLTDLRSDVAEKLVQILKGKKPFRTGWMTSRKELSGWMMSRRLYDGDVTVCVSTEMDEYEDLVYDATPDGEDLSEEEIALALDLFANEWECCYSCKSEAVLPGNGITLEAVLTAVQTLGDSNDTVLANSFAIMQGFVADILQMRNN